MPKFDPEKHSKKKQNIPGDTDSYFLRNGTWKNHVENAMRRNSHLLFVWVGNKLKDKIEEEKFQNFVRMEKISNLLRKYCVCVYYDIDNPEAIEFSKQCLFFRNIVIDKTESVPTIRIFSVKSAGNVEVLKSFSGNQNLEQLINEVLKTLQRIGAQLSERRSRFVSDLLQFLDSTQQVTPNVRASQNSFSANISDETQNSTNTERNVEDEELYDSLYSENEDENDQEKEEVRNRLKVVEWKDIEKKQEVEEEEEGVEIQKMIKEYEDDILSRKKKREEIRKEEDELENAKGSGIVHNSIENVQKALKKELAERRKREKELREKIRMDRLKHSGDSVKKKEKIDTPIETKEILKDDCEVKLILYHEDEIFHWSFIGSETFSNVVDRFREEYRNEKLEFEVYVRHLKQKISSEEYSKSFVDLNLAPHAVLDVMIVRNSREGSSFFSFIPMILEEICPGCNKRKEKK